MIAGVAMPNARRVPTGERGPPPESQHRHGVDTAAVGHAVLAVAGEHEVVRPQRTSGSDLCGFLAEQWGPEAELSLTLQRHGLGIDAADHHHVGVQVTQLVGSDVGDQFPVRATHRPLAVHGDQLDEAVEPRPPGDPRSPEPAPQRSPCGLPSRSGLDRRASHHDRALRRGKRTQISLPTLMPCFPSAIKHMIRATWVRRTGTG